jgi:hypothetical protein
LIIHKNNHISIFHSILFNTLLLFDVFLYREDEEKRIVQLGGKVIHWGRWRVQGVLAVR